MLKEFLSRIADAFRAKLGTTDKINAQNFPAKVAEVYDAGYAKGKSEGITPSGEVEITQNGTHDVAKYATAKVNVGGGYSLQDFINSRGIKNLYYDANVSTVTNEDVMWLADVDISSATATEGMFHSLKITEAPMMDLSNVTNARTMFYQCKYLQKVPKYNFDKVTDAYGLFYYCSRLIDANVINLPSCTNISYMFYECEQIENIFVNARRALSNVTYAFTGCRKAVKIEGEINTSAVTSFYSLFNGCAKLTQAPVLDARGVTNFGYIFNSCSALTSLTLKNIKENLQVGSGTSYGHLLTVDSLVGLCYELRDTGSVKTLTVGSANLEKLATVYVKSVIITDEMRAADDLIDEKLPFEVCESTDDGATLISQYIILKNWKLQ